MSAISSAVAIRVLLGHAVGEHRGAAEPVGVHDRDLGAELGGHQGRLVAAGSATDDHHTSHARHLLPVRGTTLLAVPLYAAYGSNLDPRRMGERCPHSPLRGTGWLLGWRLTFGGEDLGWDGALATIVEDPLEQVFVAVYDITDEDERLLDGWESADSGLYRKTRVRVATLVGEQLAWTYVLDAYEGGLPSASYLGILAEAAEAADAPDDYVDGAARPALPLHRALTGRRGGYAAPA